jgi:PEP-CTERM motif
MFWADACPTNSMRTLCQGTIAVLILGVACVAVKADPMPVEECNQPGLSTTFASGGRAFESGNVATCIEGRSDGYSIPDYQENPEPMFFAPGLKGGDSPAVVPFTGLLDQKSAANLAANNFFRDGATQTPEPGTDAILLGFGFAVTLAVRRRSSESLR